jgi:hypothetical protein
MKMGIHRDLEIAAGQQNAGLVPATGKYAERLEEMSQGGNRILQRRKELLGE